MDLHAIARSTLGIPILIDTFPLGVPRFSAKICCLALLLVLAYWFYRTCREEEITAFTGGGISNSSFYAGWLVTDTDDVIKNK